MARKALLIVDVQNDFCPGGALAVPNGDKIIESLNRMILRAQESSDWKTLASRDWHPPDHCSFKEHSGLWPPHCVQNTPGAEFHPSLRLTAKIIVISKGMAKKKEEYSLFDGVHIRKNDWPLSAVGLIRSCEEIYIGGLATDYCVKATALDARKLGFITFLLADTCRAVNINPDDGDKAIEEMRQAGVMFTTTAEVLGRT